MQNFEFPGMRFTVEERHLTDADGRPVTEQYASEFRSYEADSVDDVVNVYIQQENAQLIGTVLKFPGMHAVATVRKASGVYTLQITPTSQKDLKAVE